MQFFSSSVCSPCASKGIVILDPEFSEPPTQLTCTFPVGRGCPVALDVTVILTTQQPNIQGAAIVQDHALLVCEARKLAAHADACQAVGVSFISVAMETFGGMSASAVSTLACLGSLLGQHIMGISFCFAGFAFRLFQ